MDDLPELTDDEAYALLHKAVAALGNRRAKSQRAETALKAGRMMLHGLMMALVYAQERDTGELPTTIVPPVSSPRRRPN